MCVCHINCAPSFLESINHSGMVWQNPAENLVQSNLHFYSPKTDVDQFVVPPLEHFDKLTGAGDWTTSCTIMVYPHPSTKLQLPQLKRKIIWCIGWGLPSKWCCQTVSDTLWITVKDIYLLHKWTFFVFSVPHILNQILLTCSKVCFALPIKLYYTYKGCWQGLFTNWTTVLCGYCMVSCDSHVKRSPFGCL